MINKLKNKLIEVIPDFSETTVKITTKLTEITADDILSDIPFSKILKYYIELKIDIKDLDMAYKLAMSYASFLTILELFEQKYSKSEIEKIVDENYLRTIFIYAKSNAKADSLILSDYFYNNKIIEEILNYYNSFFESKLEKLRKPFSKKEYEIYFYTHLKKNFFITLENHPISYKSLITYLKSPQSTENYKLYQIERHHNKIIQDFESKPIFNNSDYISLKDVYLDQSFVLFDDHTKMYNYTWEKQTKKVSEYFNEELISVEKNNVFLVQARAGEGKSSFLKKIIYDKSIYYTNPKIYHLALRNITSSAENFFQKPLDVIISELSISMGYKISHDDLYRSTILLDGLDEISMQYNILKNDELLRQIKNISNQLTCIFIITSRIGYVNDFTLQENKIKSIKLEPFDESQQFMWVNLYNKKTKNIFDISFDQLQQLQKIQHLRNLLEIPITLYLIAELKLNIEELKSRAMLYEKLFDETINRRWESTKYQLMLNISKKDLKDILRAVANKIYQLNSQHITEEELKSLPIFNEKGYALFNYPINGLMIAFYFNKNTQKNAIEFYHKSLQDYLVAESILNIFIDYEKNCNFEFFFSELYNIASKAFLVLDIVKFIIEIINTYPDEKRKGLFLSSTDLLNKLIGCDFIYHYDYNSINTHSPMDIINNVFYAFWSVYSNLLNINKDQELRETHFKKYNNKVLKYITLVNHFIQTDRLINLGNANFHSQKLINKNLHNCVLTKANFSYSNIDTTIFSKSNLKEAKFNNANLDGLDFTNCILHEVDFDGANINQCNFRFAKIINCKFNNSNISNCIFSKSQFDKIKDSFTTANIQGNNCVF
jgi:hypothetical protein